METKYLIFGILGLILFLSFTKPPSNASAMSVCQDFDYKYNINVAPTTTTFYIGDEVFKVVPTNKMYISTLLHCGHEYRAVFTAENYETFEKKIVVGTAMPLTYEVDNIILTKSGGNE